MSSLLNIAAGNPAAGDFYDHEIEQSVRLVSGASLKNDTVAGTTRSYDSAQIFTFSMWAKFTGTGTHLISLNDTPSGGEFTILYDTDNTLRVYSNSQFDGDTTAKFRDFSSWYHICLVMDTTQATAADRARLYVNGTLHALSSQPSQNLNVKAFTTATRGAINARYQDNGVINNAGGDTYLAEFVYADGVKHEPTVFAEEKSGVWIPKDISSISLGTNGYHLDFSDPTLNVSTTTNSGFGKDVRSNMPDPQWTTQGNLATHDGMPDSPTNNFANIDRLGSGAGVFSEGDLKYVSTGDTGNGNLGVTSGKFYIEVNVLADSNSYIGICDISVGLNPNRGGAFTTHGAIAYKSNGDQYSLPAGGSSSTASYGSSYTTGDIIGISFDIDADTVTFYKNNVSQGTTTNGPSFISSDGIYSLLLYGGTSTFVVNFGQDSTFAGNETAGGNADENGIGDFYYTPQGLALCTANLPEPSITPLNDDIPEDYFDTALWTGNGTSQSISDYQFSPDFVWIKERNNTSSHNLYNTIMGTDLFLRSDTTDDEISNTVNLTSFDTNGFSLGSGGNTNENLNTYVGWSWLAGGTAVSNTDGSITSSVSANTEAGFSIVTYTGTASTATIGHGLTSAPEMIIAKNRTDSAEWLVYHASNTSAPETDYLQLNSTAATLDNANVWNDTAPTSSVFSVGISNGTNGSGDAIVCYCFHSVEGYSKIGGYTGNGSSDGTFIYTGFRPAWVMIKNTDASAGWHMYDSVRGTTVGNEPTLNSDSSSTETTSGDRIDFASNGFKLKINQTNVNASGDNYIYMAFAEMPFKYANAI